MSELFDKLVESAGHVMSDAGKGGQIQSAISGLKARLAEADRKRKVTLVKEAIGELQSREAQAINALSAQVLALYEAGTLSQPELLSLCRGVDAIREQIKEREAELAQLQPPPPPPAPTPAAPEARLSAETQPRCRHCGAPLVQGAAFCPGCGKVQSVPAPAYCAQCGAQLRENARFCPTCGEPVEA